MEVEEGMGRREGENGDGKERMKKVKHANRNNVIHGINRKVIVKNGGRGAAFKYCSTTCYSYRNRSPNGLNNFIRVLEGNRCTLAKLRYKKF